MPLYEYRCLGCQRVIEVLQKVSDRPLRRCQVCQGKLEKLISRTSFLLKGGGWFAQGYGGGAAKEKPAAGSTEKAEKTKTPKPKSGSPKKD